MKRFVYLFVSSVLLMFLSACAKSDLSGETLTPLSATVLPSAMPVQPTLVETAASVATASDTNGVVTETAVSTPTTSPTAFPTVTPTPVSTDPTFTNLHFTPADSNIPQDVFAAGVAEILAVWDYANMSATDTVRRVWHYNGEEWLVREDVWDMAQYGENGRISDISIYNFNSTGLEPGEYTLFLYINNTLTTQRTFYLGTTAPVGANTPVPTPLASAATFSNLRFEADGIAGPAFPTDSLFFPQANETTQNIFSADATDVIAVWEYANVPDGVPLRLLWDNQETVSDREYIFFWDGEKYGTSGTISDYSLKEIGFAPVTPGFYTLYLYLDDVLMAENKFVIGLSPSGQVYTDPQGIYTIEQWGNYLVTIDSDGQLHSLGEKVEEQQFGVFNWGPNGEWLVYEVMSIYPQNTFYNLIFVDLLTYYHTSRSGTIINLIGYSISPTGDYVSVLADFPEDTNCPTPYPKWQLFSSSGRFYDLESYLPLPGVTVYGIYPRTPGVWEDGGLTVELVAGCMDTSTASSEDLLLEGIYHLNLDSLTATRVGDLP